MYVPVDILCYVGCDRPPKLIPFEALVLILEDVASVALQMGGQVVIDLTGSHERKGLGVIRSDCPCQVVADLLPLIHRHAATESLLQLGRWGPAVGDHLLPLPARYLGEVTDGITNRVAL